MRKFLFTGLCVLAAVAFIPDAAPAPPTPANAAQVDPPPVAPPAGNPALVPTPPSTPPVVTPAPTPTPDPVVDPAPAPPSAAPVVVPAPDLSAVTCADALTNLRTYLADETLNFEEWATTLDRDELAQAIADSLAFARELETGVETYCLA